MKNLNSIIICILLLLSIAGAIYFIVHSQFNKEVAAIQRADSLLTISLTDSIRTLQTNIDSLKNIPPEIIIKPHTVYLPGTDVTTTIYDTLLAFPFATDTKSQTFRTTNTFYEKKISLNGKNTIVSKVIVYSDSIKKEWFIKNDLTFKQDSLDIKIDPKLFDKQAKIQFLSGIAVGKRYNDTKNAIDIQISLGALINNRYYGGVYASPNAIGIETKFNLSQLFKK